MSNLLPHLGYSGKNNQRVVIDKFEGDKIIELGVPTLLKSLYEIETPDGKILAKEYADLVHSDYRSVRKAHNITGHIAFHGSHPHSAQKFVSFERVLERLIRKFPDYASVLKPYIIHQRFSHNGARSWH